MKTMIYNVLKNYNGIAAEAAYAGRFSSGSQDECPSNECDLLLQRMAMVQSWLQLLTADERFVIQKHLIEGIDWARINYLYAEYWGNQFTKCEKTLSNYQANGLAKIETFCNKHRIAVTHLFEAYWDGKDENLPKADDEGRQ